MFCGLFSELRLFLVSRSTWKLTGTWNIVLSCWRELFGVTKLWHKYIQILYNTFVIIFTWTWTSECDVNGHTLEDKLKRSVFRLAYNVWTSFWTHDIILHRYWWCHAFKTRVNVGILTSLINYTKPGHILRQWSWSFTLLPKHRW